MTVGQVENDLTTYNTMCVAFDIGGTYLMKVAAVVSLGIEEKLEDSTDAQMMRKILLQTGLEHIELVAISQTQQVQCSLHAQYIIIMPDNESCSLQHNTQ